MGSCCSKGSKSNAHTSTQGKAVAGQPQTPPHQHKPPSSDKIPTPEHLPAFKPSSSAPSPDTIQTPDHSPALKPSSPAPSSDTIPTPDLSPAPSSESKSDYNGFRLDGDVGTPNLRNQEPYVAESKTLVQQPQQLPENAILGKPFEDVKLHYSIGRELGRGQIGVTYLCTENKTGKQYACKSISRRKLVSENDREVVKREVQIMQHLSGQPNIVEFKGAYEDKQSIHLVMELCDGGNFFDRIFAKGHYNYSERAAASILRAIVNVVHICHSMRIMYRSVRPKNFLYSSDDDVLKATNFRLSLFFEEGKVYQGIVGNPYYVAPRMLRGSYGKEIDIWSAGVILYILLSGVPPFSAGTEEGIYDAIKQGGINFDTQPWPTISTSAKDLVRKMLSRDPNKWITSDRVLNHQWIKEGGEASHYPIDIAVFTKMKQSGEKHKLKKLAQKVIAENLSFEEIQGLKELFKRMDKDNSDTITYGELKTGLKLNAQKLPHVEVQRLMDDSCVGGNGTIDYLGFIDATMHRRKLHVEECIFKALHHFDKDNSGFIARDKLEKAMKKGGLVLDDDITMQEIISKVGTDNDGKINCEEIVALMKMRYPTPFHTIPDPYF